MPEPGAPSSGMGAPRLRLGGLVLAALWLAACPAWLRGAGVPPPGSFDDLRRVPLSVGTAYAKPGARFDAYVAVMVDPVTLVYKRWPRLPTGFDDQPGNYALGPASTERLQQEVRGALERAIADSETFAAARTPAAGVLRVSPRIVDFVWEAPPVAGGTSSVVRRTGEMTLIADVHDAETGELLMRVGDRRAIVPYGASLAGGYSNHPAHHWTGVRHTAGLWGGMLREALEGVHGAPPPSGAP